MMMLKRMTTRATHNTKANLAGGLQQTLAGPLRLQQQQQQQGEQRRHMNAKWWEVDSHPHIQLLSGDWVAGKERLRRAIELRRSALGVRSISSADGGGGVGGGGGGGGGGSSVSSSSDLGGSFRVLEQLAGNSLVDPNAAEKSACGINFLAVKAGYSREVVDRLLDSLYMMNHRSGFSDPKSSDGAGMNVKLDPRFWEYAFGSEAFYAGAGAVANKSSSNSSNNSGGKPTISSSDFAVVATFVPETPDYRAIYDERLVRRLADEGLSVSAARDVPMNRSVFGVVAMTQQLAIVQLLVHRPAGMDPDHFGRALLRFQTRTDFETLGKAEGEKKPSLISAEPGGNVIYKALMASSDLALAFPDLQHPLFKASHGLIHNRFCTNAPKGLDKVQPLMCIANNGEMNNLSLLYQVGRVLKGRGVW
jgi:glutamate synthase domain-containing protein 1